MLLPIAIPLVPTAAAATIEPSSFSFINYPAPNPFGRGSNEPTIGVNWETGKVFTIGDAQVYRVTFNDLVSPPTALWEHVNSGEANGVINVDPIVYTDPQDGRTYAGGLDGACSVLAYTDDDGETWVPMTNSCAPPGWDHQTVFAGPWHEGELKDTAIYDRAVYYCAQPGLTQGPAFCGTSQDGGLTFRDSVPMYTLFECHGLHGKGKVAPDGTVGVPNKGCLTNAAIVLSEDNGLTFTYRTMPGTVKGNYDPALAWTTDNWLYLGATGGDGRAVIGMSKDKGLTWDTIKDVTPPGVTITEFAQVIAGDNERAAFAFLGSEKGPNSRTCNNAGQQIWHMYVSMTYNGGATWETNKISTDPVQRGPIGDPDNTPCRNMLDFNDVTVDAKGRVLVSYTDGCVGACAGPTGTVASSNGGILTIARQATGRGLFAAEDAASVEIVAPLVGAVGNALSLSANVVATSPYTATITWGDGSPTEVIPGQSAALFTASHSYASQGEFDITLSVVGADGSTGSDTTTASVSGGGGSGSVRIDEPTAGATVGDLVTVTGITELGDNLPPTAAFTFAVSGNTVSFDATASSDPEGSDLAFVWAFGDTTNGGGATTSHVYGSAGTYDACLTVSDGILSDELCQAVTIASTTSRTLIADDPEGDAKNPVPADPAGVIQNVPSLDIRKLEAEINPSGEPVFTMTINSITTPTAPTGEGADGAVWRVAWTNPSGKTDFVQVSVTALGTVQGGYGDTDTNGIFSQRGTAPYTFTPGTPGKFTITYPQAAIAARGYTPGATLASLTGTTLVYRGSPQDVPVSAGGTTQYDGTDSGSFVLTSFNAGLAPIGYVNTQAAKPAPSAPPADPQIVDLVVDPVGDNTPTLNIVSGWFDSDAENLYVGAKIADIPADPTATAFLYYSINFKPSWTGTDARWNGAVPAANTFTGLRATALYSPVGKNGTTPTTSDATKFELQALSVNGAQSNFGTVAAISGSISPTSDIIWWVIPRATLQNPADGDFITTTSGASAPAIGGTVTFGTAFGDSTGSGDDYTFPSEVVTPPTVTLVATPSSGIAPLSVSFAATATGATVASWSLAFGDGQVATGTGALPASFSHIYDGEGTFVASLTAIGTSGGSGTGQATIVVGTSPPAPIEIILSVEGLDPVDATCFDECATWTADLDLSTLPAGEVTITATLRNDGTPLATDSVVVNLVRTPEIVITSPANDADVPSGDITITGKITGSANRPPTASIIADQTEGLAPLTVTFTLDGMDDEAIASWRFDSDNGEIVDGTDLPATRTVTYATGTYHPSLTVIDTRGARDTFATTIVAQATNTPPTVPSDPTPANGATNVSVPAALGWTSTDPDGNTLNFDVSLGTTNPPPVVATGQTASYLAGGLAGSTTYYWSIVARDASSSTAGPVWSFTTAALPEGEASKPHTVVALIDTGMNPYHEQFRRAGMVENPSTYLSGLPASQLTEVDLCFYDPVTKTVAQSRCAPSMNTAIGNDAAAWAPFDVSPAGARDAGEGEIAWFPGTNVMMVSFAHLGDANYPGMDGARGAGDEHGTWTTSNVGGITTGTCPECIVVLIEGDTVDAITDAYWWASNQPWIDVISSSVSIGIVGLGANPADFFDATSQATKNAVSNGKLVIESSGNGIGNAGVAPTSTYLGANANPWTIAVGCSAEHTGQQCFYSDYPNPITGSGISRIGASVDTYTGTAGVGGTSFSAPSSAGVTARTIYALRSAMNDTEEGPSGASNTLVRIGEGATAPTSGPLANGALTRLELEEAIFKTARRALTPQAPWYIFPAEMPDTPANFVKAGYGQVYRGDWGINGPGAEATWSSSADATNVLLGAKAMPNRWFEEQWWETIVEPSQEEIFGAELADTDTDAFPTDDAFDPSGLDGYSGTSANVRDAISASATVPLGAVPTPSLNRLYFHHNVVGADTYENYLNSIENPAQGNPACSELEPSTACPDWWGIGGTGVNAAGDSSTYTVAYPSLGAPLLLDTTKDVVIHVQASGFIQPPTPLSIRATMMSAGALVGTGVSTGPTLVPPFESVYEIRFKPTASVLTDLVEVTIAWDGPAYSFHVSSQGASWIDLPVAATLPPVDYDPVTYYIDNFAAWTTNGGSVTITRDASKLAGDADKASVFPVPQAKGVVVNLQSDDALATGDALLASTGTASLYLCTSGTDAGAALYTAKLALSVNGVPIGGGSITKEMFGPNTGRTVPVTIPLTLNPHLIEKNVAITGAFTLSGPGGVFTQNMGVCGGGASKPWQFTIGIGELDTSPTVDIGTLPNTLSGVETISGTATFPAVPAVGEVTWYAQDMDTWDTQHDTFTMDTGAPGVGSGGPIFEPSPDGWRLTYTSVRDARQDAPAIAANGVGTASFWVTGVPAATDVTVDFTMLLQNGANQRTLGSGSLTKHIIAPLGTLAPLWDEQFIIGFTPQVTDPQPGEKLVMIVKVTNLGPATTSQIACLCGGPDMPVYVSLPVDLSSIAASPVVDLALGEISVTAPVVDGAWTADVDTSAIANGDYTLTATPRALYGGVTRTGITDEVEVSVFNAAVNTPPTANLVLSPTSGPAPLAVSVTIDGSDAETAVADLSWSLAWGDGSATETGIGLPATTSHSYAVGNHVATLTITDAGSMIGTASVPVTAFTPPPVEKVLVILDGGSPVEASDLSADGSFRDWSVTFSLPNAGVHGLTARHMRDDVVQSETTISFNTVGNLLAIEIHSPSGETTVGRNAAITGSTTYNGTVDAVEASIDGFATTTLATTSDQFATWSVDVDAIGLPEDVPTLVAIRATAVDGPEYDSVTLTRNAAPNPAIEVLTTLPVLTGESVQFQAGGALAEGGAAIVGWAWDFGNGATSTDTNPTANYVEDGTYTVTLVVTDADGESGSASTTVLVLNRLPTVALATTPTDPTTLDEVTLSASGSDIDGTIASLTTTAYAGTTRDSGVLASGNDVLTLVFPDDGNYLLVGSATDNDGGVSETESVLTIHNVRPIAALVATPTTVGVDQDVTLDATTSSDPDGSVSWYVFDLGDGTIVGQDTPILTHSYNAAGMYLATVTVTDDDGSDDTSPAVAIVANAGPTLAPIGHMAVDEGVALSFTASATDPENDPLTYALTPLPSGASFDAGTGAFSWTPTFGQEGNYPVTVSVSDGRLDDSEEIILSVGNVPLPPTLTPIGAKFGSEGEELSFLVVATDPDTAPLTFSAQDLPTGATFLSNGAFSWTPTFTQAGTYAVTFVVTDGTTTLEEIVDITIANTDRAPTLAPTAGGSVIQLSTITLPVTASDPDGDIMTFNVEGPAGITITDHGAGSATVAWTPTLDQLGNYTVTVQAMSGTLTTSQTFVVRAIFNAGVATTHVTNSLVGASPGEIVEITAQVKNTGVQQDTYRLASSNSALWVQTSLPATLTLAPGETRNVSVFVTVDPSKPITWVSISALSLGDGTTKSEAKFRIDMPTVVNVTVEPSGVPGTDLPRGTIVVTFLDGTPVAGAKISITQTPELWGNNFRHFEQGTADENGIYVWDFTTVKGGILPGPHAVHVTARMVGGYDTLVVTAYHIGTGGIL